MTEQRQKIGNRTAPSEGPLSVRQQRALAKTGAARLSIASNVTLVILKLVVGFLSGSVSIISEAVHSASDLLAAIIAFLAVRASDIPPDEEHPYGHGKIESISSVSEALLIVFAAVYIIYEAVKKLNHPGAHPPDVDAGIAVMALSVILNIFVSRRLKKVAVETESQALEADSEHLRTDVLTSLGVFAGLILTRVTGKPWLDPVTALFVSLLIVHAAYRLIREALMPLLDVRLPAEEEAAIQEILETDERVLGYHKLRTRKSGSYRHADVHVQIEDDCSLVQAHDVTEDLEDRIREVLPTVVINIHIEPFLAELRHQQEVHGVPPPAPLRQSLTIVPANDAAAAGESPTTGLSDASPSDKRARGAS